MQSLLMFQCVGGVYINTTPNYAFIAAATSGMCLRAVKQLVEALRY